MKPVVLIVLDGWGIATAGPGNAISLAKLPFYSSLLENYPHGILQASCEAVGLPKGEAGNTETGHMNLGAGFIVYQDLPRINMSIVDGSFFRNHAFLGALDHARKYASSIHLLGLVGSAGVHSNIEHLLALLQLMKEQAFTRVYLHLITDGRDSPPTSAKTYIRQIQDYIKQFEVGKIASIMGRYYAMDRDYRWERTEKAYKALTKAQAILAADPLKEIDKSYQKGVTDEFIEPVILTENSKPVALIKDNDSVIFFNFRVDRPRQLTKAFVLDNFEKDAGQIDFDPYAVKYFKKHESVETLQYKPFQRGPKLNHLYFVTMTEYHRSVHASAVAFPPHIIPHPIGEAIANAGLSQLRMTESEKERFVTYYFNGQREAPFDREDRLIVPSPKIPTYDLKPEMSAVELTDMLTDKINNASYDFILVNYANADMVGHTGNITAAIRACQTLDACLKIVIGAVLAKNGTVFITADHGNVEEMINPKTGGVDTEHSTYPVPFIAVNQKLFGIKKEILPGILGDVAPTILDLMNLKKPVTMTGRNLLENITA